MSILYHCKLMKINLIICKSYRLIKFVNKLQLLTLLVMLLLLLQSWINNAAHGAHFIFCLLSRCYWSEAFYKMKYWQTCYCLAPKELNKLEKANEMPCEYVVHVQVVKWNFNYLWIHYSQLCDISFSILTLIGQ